MKKALHDERSERMRIQAAEMEKVLKNLKPVHVPQPKDNRITELEKDLIQVKHVRTHRTHFTFVDDVSLLLMNIFLPRLYRTTLCH